MFKSLSRSGNREREYHQRSKSDSVVDSNSFRHDHLQHRRPPSDNKQNNDGSKSNKKPFTFLDKIKRFLRSSENLSGANFSSSLPKPTGKLKPRPVPVPVPATGSSPQKPQNRGSKRYPFEVVKRPLDRIARSFKGNLRARSQGQLDVNISRDGHFESREITLNDRRTETRRPLNQLEPRVNAGVTYHSSAFAEGLGRLSIFDRSVKTFAVVGSPRGKSRGYETPKPKAGFSAWDCQDTLVLGASGEINMAEMHALHKRSRRRRRKRRRLRNPRVRRRLSFGTASAKEGGDGWGGWNGGLQVPLCHLPVAV